MVENWYMEDDYTRLKGLYPAAARRIQPSIEQLCDRLEYEGSPIFDEYPDPCTLRQYGNEIYRQVQYGRGRPGEYPGTGQRIYSAGLNDRGGDGLRDLIDLLLCQEIFVRRCRHAECKKCR